MSHNSLLMANKKVINSCKLLEIATYSPFKAGFGSDRQCGENVGLPIHFNEGSLFWLRLCWLQGVSAK